MGPWNIPFIALCKPYFIIDQLAYGGKSELLLKSPHVEFQENLSSRLMDDNR
jgi:hypothetical protein